LVREDRVVEDEQRAGMLEQPVLPRPSLPVHIFLSDCLQLAA
jgi:hypothetical protein